MNKPFFSIIVCSRNRPQLVENTLFSLKNQSFKDYEVIFSDNSDPEVKIEYEKIFKRLDSEKIKYVTPNEILSMHDHYNFAIEHASGEYTGVLTDKSLLRKNALQTLFDVLNKQAFDILNYQHTGCLWYPKNFWRWISASAGNTEKSEIELYSPKEELERRFGFQFNRSHSGKYYNFGKLFFGFYHKSLLQKVKKKYGKLFHLFSPDYSSAVLALSLSSNAAYHPKKLMFAVNNYIGNGAKGATQPGATEEFIKSCGVDFDTTIAQLPIPEVYTIHNLCAYDYQVLNRFGQNEYHLDLNNLASRVAEDMKIFPYKSQDERGKFEFYFDNFCKEKNIIVKAQEHQNVNNLCEHRNLIYSLIRFLKTDKKLEKIKIISENFWFTHHRTLKGLMDE